MADDKLREKLADYVEDAHAMEQNDLKMIDSMISTTDDPQTKQMLQNHKRETEEHERRLRERLDDLGRGTSARKQAPRRRERRSSRAWATRPGATRRARTRGTATPRSTWR